MTDDGYDVVRTKPACRTICARNCRAHGGRWRRSDVNVTSIAGHAGFRPVCTRRPRPVSRRDARVAKELGPSGSCVVAIAHDRRCLSFGLAAFVGRCAKEPARCWSLRLASVRFALNVRNGASHMPLIVYWCVACEGGGFTRATLHSYASTGALAGFGFCAYMIKKMVGGAGAVLSPILADSPDNAISPMGIPPSPPPPFQGGCFGKVRTEGLGDLAAGGRDGGEGGVFSWSQGGIARYSCETCDHG